MRVTLSELASETYDACCARGKRLWAIDTLQVVPVFSIMEEPEPYV